MPTYEYECAACKHRWEADQRITDKPLEECPKCGAKDVRRLIGRSTFVLKGTGWYATDYRRRKP